MRACRCGAPADAPRQNRDLHEQPTPIALLVAGGELVARSVRNQLGRDERGQRIHVVVQSDLVAPERPSLATRRRAREPAR